MSPRVPYSVLASHVRPLGPPYVRRTSTHHVLEQSLSGSKGAVVTGDQAGSGVTRTLVEFAHDAKTLQIGGRDPHSMVLDLYSKGYMDLAVLLVVLRNELVVTTDNALRLENVETHLFEFDLAWAVWKQLRFGRQDYPIATAVSRFRKVTRGAAVKIFTTTTGGFFDALGLFGDATGFGWNVVGEKSAGVGVEYGSERFFDRHARKLGEYFLMEIGPRLRRRVRAVLDLQRPTPQQLERLMVTLLGEAIAKVQKRIGARNTFRLTVDAIDEIADMLPELIRIRAAISSLLRQGERAGFSTVLAGRAPADCWRRELGGDIRWTCLEDIDASDARRAWAGQMAPDMLEDIIETAYAGSRTTSLSAILNAWRARNAEQAQV